MGQNSWTYNNAAPIIIAWRSENQNGLTLMGLHETYINFKTLLSLVNGLCLFGTPVCSQLTPYVPEYYSSVGAYICQTYTICMHIQND